jgi:hypothetical protein
VSEKNKRVFKVLKEEYSQNYVYNVFLRRDTIESGEDFHADIIVDKPSYRIVLSSPEQFTDTRQTSWEYDFKPEEEGIHEFKGLIEFDSLSIPFEYKFIVLPKK